jgi:N-acetylglucosamine malate deacetylase 1
MLHCWWYPMYDVLLFSAHPDDVDFGMGGTFLKLARSSKVAHVILTRGESGTYGTPKEREEEAKCAAKFAGAELEFLNFTDNHVEDTVENAKLIAGVIRKYKPKVIFVPYHTNNSTHVDGRAHPDHLALGKIVLAASRFAKFKNAPIAGEHHTTQTIVYYMVPAYARPTFYVDISDEIGNLEKLWQCYASQLSIRSGKITEILKAFRRNLGLENGCDYAEGFIVDSPIRMDTESILRL